jgi:DNA (cytosine-5)-methyltransferase 1
MLFASFAFATVTLARKKRDDLALKGRWANLLPSIPEGKNYLWHTNRGGGKRLFGWRTKYWSFLLKLAKNQPAWTIPAQPAQNAGPFHWANRQLRTSEMLKLQTIPSNIFVAGTRADRQRQIGNAVPSLLAEAIGRAAPHAECDAARTDKLTGKPRIAQW